MRKIAFVTGGDKGIGKATVVELSKSFEHVIFTYKSDLEKAKELVERVPNCSYYQCNIGDLDQTKEVGEKVIKEFGAIQTLVNNAGIDRDSTFLKMERESWDQVIDINLKAAFNFTKCFLPGMVENEDGRIINITSIAGFTGAFGKTNYATAKAGLVGFTKSLAIEVAAKKVTVNAVAPGAIETDMLFRIPEKYRLKILESIPSNRFGKPEEIAFLISFLASDKASYITGQTLHVNGGSFLI